MTVNFQKRVLSGGLFAALVVFCVFAGPLPVALGALLLSTVSLAEFYRLMKVKTYLQRFGYFLNAALIVLFLVRTGVLGFAAGHSLIWAPLIALVSFHMIGHLMGTHDKLEDSLQYQSGSLLIGFLWISQTLALSLLIYSYPRGAWWLFLGVAAAAFCDIGAFWVGTAFGRHKLAPQISPYKSVEGLIGGIFFSVVSCLILGQFVELPIPSRVFLGILLAFAAVLGDLLESYFKRKIGVKDSGTIVVGHGGMLDRIDSHLLMLPALFAYLVFFRG